MIAASPSGAGSLPADVDPVRLAEYLFRHDHYDRAAEIVRAIFRPHAKVAVKGCHASGKTFATGDIILLALLLGGDVVTTAPTHDQVKGILWEHVHAALADSVVPIAEWGAVTQVEIVMPTGEKAIGRSTDRGVRFQGYHAKPGRFLLVIADESPGVLQAVMKAVEGISAGGDVRILFLGNPVDPSGPFFEIFAGEGRGWTRITISAFDTPNLAGLTLPELLALPEDALDRNDRPYLVTRRWVADKWHEWGAGSPDWEARVLGQFPSEGLTTLIPLAWAEGARARQPDPTNEATISAGIDVAGPGEAETVLYLRRGGDVLGMQIWADADPRAEVIAELTGWVERGLRFAAVDKAGLGWYFYRDIRAALEPLGVGVRGVNVGEASDVLDDRGDRRFANLKAQFFWGLRERFRDGTVAGLADPATIAQLAGVKYAQPRGIVTIEKKEDALKRGVKSPDRAEALMLSFAPDDPMRLYAKAFGLSGKIGPDARPARTTAREPWLAGVASRELCEVDGPNAARPAVPGSGLSPHLDLAAYLGQGRREGRR